METHTSIDCHETGNVGDGQHVRSVAYGRENWRLKILCKITLTVLYALHLLIQFNII